MWRKFSAWLLTDSGKKFSYFTAGTLTTGVLFGQILPHTIFLDKYQDFFRLYKNGFSVSLPPKLHSRFQKTLDLLEIEQEDQKLFKPFATSTFEIFSAGNAMSKFGVAVGIPVNFTYEDTSQVDKSALKLAGEQVMWELEEGELLLKSLVMSESAQMYAIAKEIKYRMTPKLMIDAVVSMSCCTGLYGICRTINTKQNLYARPFVVRLVLYCIIGAFTYGSYALCKDFSQVYYEGEIDKELKNTHPIFAEGGKEYYSNILQRNIALRKLLGKEGENAFSVLGNQNFFLRTRNMPLTQRKSFFDEPQIQQVQ